MKIILLKKNPRTYEPSIEIMIIIYTAKGNIIHFINRRIQRNNNNAWVLVRGKLIKNIFVIEF